MNSHVRLPRQHLPGISPLHARRTGHISLKWAAGSIIVGAPAVTRYFGGSWTEEKLDILEAYLAAYLKVLKKQRFSLGYIDAFAGDGSIQLATSESEAVDEVEGLVKGSAQRALALDPGFDGYLFIEQDPVAVQRLKGLKQQYPGKELRVAQAQHESARMAVRCAGTETGRSGVMLLSFPRMRSMLDGQPSRAQPLPPCPSIPNR